MILPVGYENMTDAELIEFFMSIGDTRDGAEAAVAMIRSDDHPPVD